MSEQRSLPDLDRTSVLSASVLLAFLLTRVVRSPDYTLELHVFSFYLALPVNLGTLAVLMAAGMTATGMNYLIREHPSLGEGRVFHHWFLPTLTTLVVGIALSILPFGLLWWVGFSIGGVLLTLAFVAEYIVIEPGNPLYPAAMAILTALSFALYLILTIALRYAEVRLFLMLPALAVAAFLVSLRALHLRLGGRWPVHWAVGIALINGQLAAGLHYWPLRPIPFGLALLAPLYALTGLAAALEEDVPLRRAVVEPIVMLTLIIAVAFLFR